MNAPAPDTPAIELRNVTVRFGSEVALENVSLQVPDGDFLGILGPNGAGKSVLLGTMLGQIRPQTGKVLVRGEPVEKAHGRITYVPQFANFDASFPVRVRDVVLMGRLAQGRWFRRYSDEDHRQADEAIERLDLTSLRDRQVGHLSGGELQRVLIARALTVGARILLLDEPSASLDARVEGRLFDLLKELSQTHTLVLVSHDIGVMSQYVTSLACINRRLVQHGSPHVDAEILRQTYGHPVEIVSHHHEDLP